MPRPCEGQHELSPETCRFCHLWLTDVRYQALWGKPPGAGSRAGSRTLECVHLGEATGETRPCPTCTGTVEVPLLNCAVHGQCTRNKLLPGVACCSICPDRKDPDEPPALWPFTGPIVRHLVYHVYPVAGNGAWQWNVEQIRRRIGVFNGHRVVAIVCDGTTDSPEAVKRAFGPDVHEFIVTQNDPALREVATFEPLMDRVSLLGPSHITFFGHAKGVTRPQDDGSTVRRWTEIQYETCLDYLPRAEWLLQRHPLAGSFKKVGAGFVGSASNWHYSGTFFWLRNSQVFKRHWRQIDRQWWGVESWPGLHWRPEEAGLIFHEGRVPQLDLYEMRYMTGTVLPALQQWRRDHAQQRSST